MSDTAQALSRDALQALGLLFGIVVVFAFAAICYGRAYRIRYPDRTPGELLCEWWARRKAYREKNGDTNA